MKEMATHFFEKVIQDVNERLLFSGRKEELRIKVKKPLKKL